MREAAVVDVGVRASTAGLIQLDRCHLEGRRARRRKRPSAGRGTAAWRSGLTTYGQRASDEKQLAEERSVESEGCGCHGGDASS